eukprot:6189336-Pleurochrysis_carterae.AAC.1
MSPQGAFIACLRCRALYPENKSTGSLRGSHHCFEALAERPQDLAAPQSSRSSAPGRRPRSSSRAATPAQDTPSIAGQSPSATQCGANPII